MAGKGPEYRISPLTIAKVQAAAEKIKYRGSSIARSLRTQRSGLIGVVVPDIANPVFSAIAGAVTRAVEQRGYSVLMTDSRDSTEREASQVAELAARQVEGLVVCPVGETPEHLLTVADDGLPIVTVDRVFSQTNLPTVCSDQRRGAELAVQALVDAGHRTIGCLQGMPNAFPNRERVNAYYKTIEAAGLPRDDDLVEGSEFSVANGVESCERLLRRRPDITAIFALSNQLAIGALETLKKFGIDLPQSLSIVAFDDHPLAPYLTPPLTACDQDESAMGQAAAALLLESISAGKTPSDPHRVVPVEFRPRGSIAAPRQHDLNVSSWPVTDMQLAAVGESS